MDDVAARAGVSRALVSLVMRGSPKVSEERRRAVHEAAEELGYAPHAMARSLASRTATVLGVLVADLHNPFFAEVLDGLDAAARQAGYDLIVNTGGRSPARERTAAHSLLSFRPAGLALLGPTLPAAAIAELAGQAPVVLIGRDTRLSTVDTVNDDGRAGAALAVEHLVALGHQRIAHLDGGSGSQAAPRRSGYREAMRAAGLPPDVVPGDVTEPGGARAAAALLTRPGPRPTAILAANDMSALGALSTLAEAGLRVPDDISLVGYDNTALAGLRHIGLTTVDQSRAELGRLAAQALLHRITAPGDAPNAGTTDGHPVDAPAGAPQRHRLRPSLVIRTSTARLT